ncbi:biotin--[acetyl-CoA-carboxylase] ligase [Desulfosediminicola ganghwensis]|uniref:biotin--[acetyl-CoA-carboxylase] ligase n=1 Tax=Desulfosediminicola ganghwensis TaxID=2569540 RepID=UPI0010ACD72A|nr:biotin--[acetyl-CoA-carboxylase] ligase [Desulfosediminicola ganghwensis]
MAHNQPTPELLAEAFAKELSLREKRCPDIDSAAVLRYGQFVGSTIDCHESLPRAMDHARAHVHEVESQGGSVANGRVILADTMSRSKGRFTRAWHAPAGGVWGCMLHASTLLDISKRFVPLAVGVACCEAIREFGGGGANLRWVNDVLFGQRKVAGFLVEGHTGACYGEEYHLVGFGININNNSFPEELSPIATSLAKELGREFDLTDFTTTFLAKLAWNFGLIYYEEAQEMAGETYSGVEGTHRLLESWLSLSSTIGKRVVFGFDVMTSPQYEATVIGVDDGGGLQLQFDDGAMKTEYSGEIRYI